MYLQLSKLAHTAQLQAGWQGHHTISILTHACLTTSHSVMELHSGSRLQYQPHHFICHLQIHSHHHTKGMGSMTVFQWILINSMVMHVPSVTCSWCCTVHNAGIIAHCVRTICFHIHTNLCSCVAKKVVIESIYIEWNTTEIVSYWYIHIPSLHVLACTLINCKRWRKLYR